jgi:hypothetical protein
MAGRSKKLIIRLISIQLVSLRSLIRKLFLVTAKFMRSTDGGRCYVVCGRVLRYIFTDILKERIASAQYKRVS